MKTICLNNKKSCTRNMLQISFEFLKKVLFQVLFTRKVSFVKNGEQSQKKISYKDLGNKICNNVIVELYCELPLYCYCGDNI